MSRDKPGPSGTLNHRQRSFVTHYLSYKPSGVPWLGDLPEHWEVARLKGNVANIVDLTNERGSDEVCLALEHVESWTGRVHTTGQGLDFSSQAKRFRAGDVLFGKLRPYLAKVTRPHQNGVCVGEFLVLRPRHANLLSSYLERLLRSKPVIDAVDASAFGAKMPRADWRFIGGMAQPLPPLPEQTAIARYLDYTDRRIQRYLRAKQKLITLLEEQRQAIIHQAVTGQIDVRTGQPYPAYQDSGVEWLGEVPERWEVRKLRRCVTVSGGMTPSMEVRRFWGGLIPWVTPKDMKRAVISDSSLRVTDSALQETQLRLVEPPAVLIVVRGMILARRVPIASTTAPVTINQDMKALRTVKGTKAAFLARLLDSAQEAFMPLIDEAGHGTRRLPMERWRELVIAIPPEAEQAAIVEHLDNRTAAVDTAISHTQHQIDLLSEYRTRLISDVVTGKLDVREAAAKLPEVDPLETEDDSEEALEPTAELAEEFEAIAEGASA